MPKGAKKGKAATPTEIRRNARALMTESAAYREAAEKAERSDRSPDRDMSIFLRDALAQEIEVATDILMRASDKASDCADLTRAYEHARRTLENPLGKDLSEEQTDKKQKKKTYADKAKTPATESPNTNSADQPGQNPTKQTHQNGQQTNQGPNQPTNSQPIPDRKQPSNQQPFQPINQPLTRSTSQPLIQTTNQPPIRSNSLQHPNQTINQQVRHSQPFNQTNGRTRTEPTRQSPPRQTGSTSQPGQKSHELRKGTNSVTSSHRSTNQDQPKTTKTKTIQISSRQSEARSAITESSHSCPSYRPPSTHLTKTSRKTNTTIRSAQSNVDKSSNFRSVVSDANSAEDALRENHEEAEKEREEIRSQHEATERRMREEARKVERQAREEADKAAKEAERAAKIAREKAEQIARETNEQLQQAIRQNIRQENERVKSVNQREQDKHGNILETMTSSSSSSQAYHSAVTGRQDAATKNILPTKNNYSSLADRQTEGSPDRHRSVSEVSEWTFKIPATPVIPKTTTATIPTITRMLIEKRIKDTQKQTKGQKETDQNQKQKEKQKQTDTDNRERQNGQDTQSKTTGQNRQTQPTTQPNPQTHTSNHSIHTWVEDAAVRTEELRAAARESTHEEIRSVAEEAVRATLKAAGLRGTNTRQRSTLEALKVAERGRPDHKFDGVDKAIDFDDHMRQFESVVDIDDLAPKDKLKEFKFWFAKLAYGRVSPYLRREDAEAAFGEATERLKKEYAKKVRNAEDMLSGVLKGEAIKKHEYEKAQEFILKVEEVYTMAVETNRQADFNRNSIIKRILQEKLPFLKEKWSWHATRRQTEDLEFKQFLEFLLLHMRAATKMFDYDDDFQPKAKSATSKPATINAMSSEQNQPSHQPTKPTFQNQQNQQSTSFIQTPNPAYTAAFSTPQQQYNHTFKPTQPTPFRPTSNQNNIAQRLTALSTHDYSQMARQPPPNYHIPTTTTTPNPLPTTNVKPGLTTDQNGKPIPFCGYCKEGHWIDACPQFSNLSKNEKKTFLDRTKRCTKCGRKHTAEVCTFKYNCRKCGNNHVSALHDINEQDLLTGPNITPNITPAIPPATPSTSKQTEQA